MQSSEFVNIGVLQGKTLQVIASCETSAQLQGAHNFIILAEKRVAKELVRRESHNPGAAMYCYNEAAIIMKVCRMAYYKKLNG